MKIHVQFCEGIEACQHFEGDIPWILKVGNFCSVCTFLYKPFYTLEVPPFGSFHWPLAEVSLSGGDGEYR